MVERGQEFVRIGQRGRLIRNELGDGLGATGLLGRKGGDGDVGVLQNKNETVLTVTPTVNSNEEGAVEHAALLASHLKYCLQCSTRLKATGPSSRPATKIAGAAARITQASAKNFIFL